MIFHYGPYFMGFRGIYIRPWSLDFNPKEETTIAPLWVRLPPLPLIS